VSSLQDGPNLVLKVHKPALLYLGPEGNGDGEYEVASRRCRTGFAAWPSAPDLLVASTTREFCGVVYSVAAEYRVEARVLASFLDSSVVRYIGGSPSARPAAYGQESEDAEFLQITWSSSEPDDVKVAQLGGDYWYYLSERDGTDMQRFWAFGLSDVPGILGQYQLTLPKRFSTSTSLIVRESR